VPRKMRIALYPACCEVPVCYAQDFCYADQHTHAPLPCSTTGHVLQVRTVGKVIPFEKHSTRMQLPRGQPKDDRFVRDQRRTLGTCGREAVHEVARPEQASPALAFALRDLEGRREFAVEVERKGHADGGRFEHEISDPQRSKVRGAYSVACTSSCPCPAGSSLAQGASGPAGPRWRAHQCRVLSAHGVHIPG